MPVERVLRWSLVIVAIVGLAVGIVAHLAGRSGLADFFWMLATVPVIAGLAVSIGRDLLAGRLGVDAIALLSMTAALVLGQPLAGAVIALMYSGGNVLEALPSLAPSAICARLSIVRRVSPIAGWTTEQLTCRSLRSRSVMDSWCEPAKSFRSTVSSTRTRQRSTSRR